MTITRDAKSVNDDTPNVHRSRIDATICDWSLAETADEFIALHDRIDALESVNHHLRERLEWLERAVAGGIRE